MIGLKGGISIAIALILCAALAIIGWGAKQAADYTIIPAMSEQARSVGRSAAALIESGVAAGIPIDRMVGVSAYFDDLRTKNPDLAELRLVAPDGRILGQSGAAPAGAQVPAVLSPVTSAAGAPLATLVITLDPARVWDQVSAILVDVAFIGIVSLLVALELVALVVGTRGIETLSALEARVRALTRGRLGSHAAGHEAASALLAPIDRQVNALNARHVQARAHAVEKGDRAALEALEALTARTGLGTVQTPENHAAALVRPALFLFMLAEELTRPFLPRLVPGLLSAGTRINLDLALSLPIVVFMATVALCQLPFAVASERLGRRRGFVLGAAIAALAYAASGLADTYLAFLAARLMSAVGYALVFVSAQGHVIDHSNPSDRAAGLAVFVRAIMVAGLCGPPIGGVIADHLGGHMALLASAALAGLALLVGFFTLPRSQPKRTAAGASPRALMGALKVPRLAPLLFGCAMPAKLLLAAVCFYLVPVALQREGYSAAAIGRLQMIYPILMVLAVPVFAALAATPASRPRLVAAGGLVAGAGTALLLIGTSLPVIGAVLALIGLGQAMSISAQSALVADSAEHPGAGGSAGVIGLFRLIERTGNAIGPMAAGLLLASVGFAGATTALGGLVVAGALGFALSGRSDPTSSHASPAGAQADAEGSPL